ncbi:hypothetical protein [Modestobacter versicolor]|uniref:hypothetical protein n=1 Tax=Modestobacter versicolor TaxID=429133 RepID=UPI0034DFD3E7
MNTNQAVNLNNRPQGFNYAVIYAEGLNNALPDSIPNPAHEIGFFLQSVSKFNNSQSYQYNCRVDVFGTWGLYYMSALEGTLVNVKRMHEDR